MMRIKPKKIMCAIDFSDFTNHVLAHGMTLAKEFHSKLLLCHIVPDITPIPYSGGAYIDSERLIQQGLEYAQTHLENLIKAYKIDGEPLVSNGYPAEEIQEFAETQDIDMVITATHGLSGVKKFLVGSVTERLMKTLTCPLLVLHAHDVPMVSPLAFE
ncbi:MAG: universal stress protein, partial [Desulfobacteraceae bacterium]|nr:universal stress protein [Desulfobacteraceae bacterium]